ncbi:MAG: hypothetical protein ACJAYJ_003241 [Saprospiraceae bacterium]
MERKREFDAFIKAIFNKAPCRGNNFFAAFSLEWAVIG